MIHEDEPFLSHGGESFTGVWGVCREVHCFDKQE